METIVAGLVTGWITLLVLSMSWMVKGRLDEMGESLRPTRASSPVGTFRNG